MSNLLHAFNLIEKIENKNLSGPKDEKLILKAEQVLGLKFPPTYRFFLRKYGSGSILVTEIYGLIDNKFDYRGALDSVGLTLDERKTGCPYPLVIIANSGFGPNYVLDSSQPGQDGEYPVLLWMPGNPLSPTERVNNDFGEFLLKQIQEDLAYENDE